MGFNFSKARLSIFCLNQCYTLILINVFNMKIYWLLTIKATKAKSIKIYSKTQFYTRL